MQVPAGVHRTDTNHLILKGLNHLILKGLNDLILKGLNAIYNLWDTMLYLLLLHCQLPAQICNACSQSSEPQLLKDLMITSLLHI